MVEIVKATIIRILLAHKGEITLDKIVEEYRKSSGESLAEDIYGFKSIEDLLETFKDVLRITSGEGNKKVLQLIGDDTTAYIQQLLTNQRHRRDKSKQLQTQLRPSRNQSPSHDIKISISSLPSNSPPVSPGVSRMDQGGRERGVGRGRGRLLMKALSDVQSIDKPGKEPVRENTLTDEQIKRWIIKVLSDKNGFFGKFVPPQFESEFKRKAPGDLLLRVKSLVDTIDVQEGPAGDIFYLKKAIRQTVNKESIEKAQVTSNEEKKCENNNEPDIVKSIEQWQIPAEGSKIDVHVLYANAPNDFCICPFVLHPKLNSLMIDLHKHFENNTQMAVPEQRVIPGGVFAGQYEGKWYRVRVETSSDTDNKVVANLADYAFQTSLSAVKLVTLPDKFSTLPLCGVKAQLYDVLPNDLDKGWTEEEIDEFKKIVDRRDFVCVMFEGGGEEGRNKPVGVRLIDTSEDEDVVVDEILEELGLISRTQFE